ncbi:hypothetical protein GJ496_004946 [Pomphorhynchus laevis]|nr:hypothetical protein GJ496_004946 [Pomphorhynchus laevis]
MNISLSSQDGSSDISFQDAYVKIRVQDVGRADAPATVLASMEQPIYELPTTIQFHFDRSCIERAVTPCLSVQIEDSDGKLCFINDYRIPLTPYMDHVAAVLQPIR